MINILQTAIASLLKDLPENKYVLPYNDLEHIDLDGYDLEIESSNGYHFHLKNRPASLLSVIHRFRTNIDCFDFVSEQDKEYVVTGHKNNVIVWELSNPPRSIKLLPQMTESRNNYNVTSICITEKVIAVGRDDSIIAVFDSKDYRRRYSCRVSLLRNKSVIKSLSAKWNDNVIAVLGDDDVLRTINISNGEVKTRIAKEISKMAHSRTAPYILATDTFKRAYLYYPNIPDDGRCKRTELTLSRFYHTPSTPDTGISAIATADWTYSVAICQGSVIKIYGPERPTQHDLIIDGGSGSITCACFYKDASYLAVGEDFSVAIWDLSLEKKVFNIELTAELVGIKWLNDRLIVATKYYFEIWDTSEITAACDI